MFSFARGRHDWDRVRRSTGLRVVAERSGPYPICFGLLWGQSRIHFSMVGTEADSLSACFLPVSLVRPPPLPKQKTKASLLVVDDLGACVGGHVHGVDR